MPVISGFGELVELPWEHINDKIERRVLAGKQGMIGSVGEARTDIDPEGKVFVQGELWNAHAPSRVQMGEQVVVKKIEGLELEVEKVT